MEDLADPRCLGSLKACTLSLSSPPGKYLCIFRYWIVACSKHCSFLQDPILPLLPLLPRDDLTSYFSGKNEIFLISFTLLSSIFTPSPWRMVTMLHNHKVLYGMKGGLYFWKAFLKPMVGVLPCQELQSSLTTSNFSSWILPRYPLFFSFTGPSVCDPVYPSLFYFMPPSFLNPFSQSPAFHYKHSCCPGESAFYFPYG